MSIADNTVNPDTNQPEDSFRYRVRDVLLLSWDIRDDAIIKEVERLKRIEKAYASLALVHCSPVVGLDSRD
jgi:hypothetical protein